MTSDCTPAAPANPSNASWKALQQGQINVVTDDHPHEAIIRMAKARGCDLIVISSNGRSGIEALLLGSGTQKVLTYSTLPMLVLR